MKSLWSKISISFDFLRFGLDDYSEKEILGLP